MVSPACSPQSIEASFNTGSSARSATTSVISTTLPNWLRVTVTSSYESACEVGVVPSVKGVVATTRGTGRRNLIMFALFFGIGLVMPNFDRHRIGSA